MSKEGFKLSVDIMKSGKPGPFTFYLSQAFAAAKA